jgi:hypothetical protein
MSHIQKRFICFLVCSYGMIASSWGCGVNSHLWITDSAICQLPVGSKLRVFYEDQTHVNLTRLGSAFPDSGYAINHPYGEVAHWPPFVQAYVEDFHDRYGNDESAWSEVAYDEVAFILGVAAHGYEDELFDSQFLRWVEQEDLEGQDIIDPAIDFLLIYEGHTELLPPLDFPSASATSALQRAGVDVTEAEVSTGVARVHQFALRLSQSPTTLQALVERDAPLIPWATQHYLNRNITGSLAHEPARVAALLEGLFDRLSGLSIADQVISHVDPSVPKRLNRDGLSNRDQSQWITFYFKTGVLHDSVIENLILRDATGEPVMYHSRGTRWGGGNGYTRLFEISPTTPPIGNEMTIQVLPGLTLIDGSVSTIEYRYRIELCEGEGCRVNDGSPLSQGGHQQGCWVADPIPIDQGSIDNNNEFTDAMMSPTLDLGIDQNMAIDQNISDEGISIQSPVELDSALSEEHHQMSGSRSGCDLYRHHPDKMRFYPVRLEIIFIIIFVNLCILTTKNKKRSDHDT